MLLKDFDYELPKELIAQTPVEPRDYSRLLILDKKRGKIEDGHFYDILSKLGRNDVLVLNKTKVINARLKGELKTGLKNIEIFLHKQIDNKTWDCLVYPGKKLKIGVEVYFGEKGELKALIKGISEKGRIVEFSKGGEDFLELIEKLGETPLPPYIKKKLENNDRYQTVFNENYGSVAAPTAGLHFTDELLKKLIEKGIKIEKILLHVGLGTFMGVETENIKDHKMHSEFIEIEKETCERLNEYKKQGKNIIAVGTTSVRTIESFCEEKGVLGYGKKETNIFIYPGYEWKFVDNLITNFHLPKSTLLMLVSSFGGVENIKKSYKYAIKNGYRFFSFGDAMWIK